MNAWRTTHFLAIRRAVRKYQRQIVLSIRSEGTLVPLAKADGFYRLFAHLFLPVAE